MKQRRGWSRRNCSVSRVRDCLGTSLEMVQLSEGVISEVLRAKPQI